MSDAVLNLIVIRSADLDRAAHFYSALGIRVDRERHGSGPEHLVGIAGSVTFEVYPVADAMSTIGVRLGFRVQSMADAVAAACEGGGSIVSPPRASAWGLRAVVTDPDGHRVELSEGDGP
jgi:predicted enzyme related to lactoylglutathione lyase